MLNSGPSGFHNAPITKSILLLTGLASVGASVLKIHSLLEFPNLSDVISHYQVWRLFTSHLFFTSPGEVLFGFLLIYYFRLFERQMGSSKFGGYTAVVVSMSTLLQIAAYVIFPTAKFTPGPYSWIFACFVLFWTEIPATYRFRLVGISATDKLFTYILGLQLLFSNSPSSVISGVCGILSGLIYRSESLGLHKFRLPKFINHFLKRFILPLIESSRPSGQRPTPISIANPVNRAPAVPPAFVNPNFGAQAQGYAEQLLPTNLMASGFLSPPVRAAPTAESIEMLISMGFPRQAVLDALARCNNNVEMATHVLLDQN